MEFDLFKNLADAYRATHTERVTIPDDPQTREPRAIFVNMLYGRSTNDAVNSGHIDTTRSTDSRRSPCATRTSFRIYSSQTQKSYRIPLTRRRTRMKWRRFITRMALCAIGNGLAGINSTDRKLKSMSKRSFRTD